MHQGVRQFMNTGGVIAITGGCGFIGVNLARRLLQRGRRVRVIDGLLRHGSEQNLAVLRAEAYGQRFEFVQADVRDAQTLTPALSNVDAIVHLAAQVAVTTSVEHPRTDFEINALGTLNVLEAARANPVPPLVLFTSTNKVYGACSDTAIVEQATRYAYADGYSGISEQQALDFHSPYGCSKGCADQYVRDYSRIYGLPTTVVRMSCIYGPFQHGTEDQGWVAHFAIQALRGEPITIFGDGKQVRDLLFIDDLIDLFEQILEQPYRHDGQVFNVGGGADNTLSIWQEFAPLLATMAPVIPVVQFQDWRPGDQRIYVSDISKVQRMLGWRPQVAPPTGIERLITWLCQRERALGGLEPKL